MRPIVTEKVFTLNDVTFETILGFTYSGVKYFPRRVHFGSEDSQIQVSSFRQMISGWSSWRYEEGDIQSFRDFLQGKEVFEFANKTELLHWLAE